MHDAQRSIDPTPPSVQQKEFMKRGKELYERFRPRVEEGNRGKVVAIDLDTGE